jgi:ABC-type amino acid transport substrate-binding protein
MFFEDVPPFFMHNKQKELGGIDILLAEDIAKKLGVPVKFDRSSKTFDAIVDKVAEGEADVAISLLSNTLSRATQVRFSNDYAVLRQTLLIDRLQLAQRFPTAETAKQIQTLLNQKDLKIGVISGTSYVDFVGADYPLATRVLYDDFPTMMQDLQKGEIFALLYDELEIMNWRNNTPDGGLRFKIVLLNNRKDTIAFAVNRANQDLLAWLNLYLDKIRSDETLDEILNTYLKENNWRTE